MGRTSDILAVAAVAMGAVSGAHAADEPARDPYFGEALYHAYQGHYFEALQRLDGEMAQHYGLDEPQLDSFFRHIDHAEFSVGDFELHYRMHHRAGRAIRAVLEADVEDTIRNEAAYRLARIHFHKGQPEDALQVLDAMHGELPRDLVDDVAFLRANVYMAIGRTADAVQVLRKIPDTKELKGFTDYNLGIALWRDQKPEAAFRQLDRAGRVSAGERETRAIRDKANLVLGTFLLEAEQFGLAQRSLDRVRLDGPFSNRALLGAGWADASAENYQRAVVPWSILAKRDSTDEAVQEVMLALPFAYGELEVHSRAAVLYERAVTTFGAELEKVDASIVSIRKGEFLRALVREEIRQDKDWVIRLRALPESPETYYLISLMASHDFQTSLQNYLDLEDLRKRLVGWRGSLDAFEDIIGHRRRYYEPLLPTIDTRFRRLDAQLRLRTEQRKHVAQRLERILTAPSPELLATADEQQLATSLDRLEGALDPAGRPDHAALQRRIDRLRGVLHFTLETDYDQRLTDAHQHLRDLDAGMQTMQARYQAFVRARQASLHSYVGYEDGITDLRRRVHMALGRLETLMARQGHMLEKVAIRELETRRGRLEAYQNQARFAFADSYDRAIKAQGWVQ